MTEYIKLRKYTNNDYMFVYEIKKNAYKKYVEECWGSWVEKDQQKYFENFINQVKENAYIIQYDNKDIGFYNGEILKNGNYEIGNICIISEYQNKGIGTKILKGILEKYSNTNIEIQYFKQNPVGILYERLGFEKSGETNFHYQMVKYKTIK
ncbi:MAG: GNAT family N-acetyltransferase [Clostridia bacterium]|nr:GNAT family N-acetyltransferase [Clostridia bacterium]